MKRAGTLALRHATSHNPTPDTLAWTVLERWAITAPLIEVADWNRKETW